MGSKMDRTFTNRLKQAAAGKLALHRALDVFLGQILDISGRGDCFDLSALILADGKTPASYHETH